MEAVIYSTQGDGKAWPLGTYYNTTSAPHLGPGGPCTDEGKYTVEKMDDGFAVINGEHWALREVVSGAAYA